MQYKRISDKQEFYNHRFIDTKGDFNDFLDNLKAPSENIWRGLNNALFANYTSLQRQNLLKKDLNSYNDVLLYLDRIFAGFDNWNKGLLVKCFRNYDIKKIPIFSKLSILRHYGVPTPTMDWTRNPFVALYFATENLSKFLKFYNNRYISLYCITSEHPYYLFDFKTGFSNEIKGYDSYVKGLNERLEIMSKHCDSTMLEHSKANFHKEFCQSAFNDLKFIYGNMQRFPIQKIEDSENDDFLFYLKNNYNITNQEGLFILNLYPYLPLEQAIFERIKEQTDDSHKRKVAFNRCRENFLCYDISVKLVPKIKEYLNSIGINRDFIYPDLNRLKNDIK